MEECSEAHQHVISCNIRGVLLCVVQRMLGKSAL